MLKVDTKNLNFNKVTIDARRLGSIEPLYPPKHLLGELLIMHSEAYSEYYTPLLLTKIAIKFELYICA